MFTGWNPSFMILPTPPPKGTVHTLPPVALQLVVTIGEVVRYQPFFRQAQRDYRLNVQNILGAVGRPGVEVPVILNGSTDEVGHRILRFFSQFLGIRRCRRRCLRGNLSSRRANRGILCEQRRC